MTGTQKEALAVNVLQIKDILQILLVFADFG